MTTYVAFLRGINVGGHKGMKFLEGHFGENMTVRNWNSIKKVIG